jgi:hypothetical protein
MNKNIAYVFPETLPDERLLFPLVQVFGQVVYMQAIENELAKQEVTTPLIERCQQLGRLQRFTPAPLGEQRERFLALVQDMRRRGVDYTSQLSMLTLAGLNHRDHAESKNSILSNLLQRSDIKEQKEAELLLWQSRLLLKLGEFYDLEQTELNKVLCTITERQDTLLADLCEEMENPFVLPDSRQSANQETDGLLHHRLKAWSRLFFHGNNLAPGFFVTRHRAAMDLLQEVYEKLCRQSARQLISLELPYSIPPSGYNTTLDEPLAQQCPSLHLALSTFAAGISEGQLAEELEQLLREGRSQWSQCLSRHFPSGLGEHCFLDLFYFPKISARQLWVESFKGGVLANEQGEEGVSSGCVVGLLRRD